MPLKVRFARDVSVPAGVESVARLGAEMIWRRERVPGRWIVQVIWTRRAKVRALNRRFRGTNRFTDVIAFRYGEAPGSGMGGQESAKNKGRNFTHPFFRLPAPGPRSPLFGDVYVAVPQARMNARRFRVPFPEELVRLVVHGVLHLLGYTDYRPAKKRRMWRVQENVVRRVLHA